MLSLLFPFIAVCDCGIYCGKTRMQEKRKIRENLFAASRVCSILLIMVGPGTSIAGKSDRTAAPVSSAGNLMSFSLTFAPENDIIRTIGIAANGGELASAAPARVMENSNLPQAVPFLRGAEGMRLSAVFISCAFCGAASVLSLPVIGKPHVTEPAVCSDGVTTAGQFRSHFQTRNVYTMHRHNSQSLDLRRVSAMIGAGKSLSHVTGPNPRGEIE